MYNNMTASPEGIRNLYQFFIGPISECLLFTIVLCAVHILIMVQIVMWANLMEAGFVCMFIFCLCSHTGQSQVLSAKFPLKLIFTLKNFSHKSKIKILSHIFNHLVKYEQTE